MLILYEKKEKKKDLAVGTIVAYYVIIVLELN